MQRHRMQDHVARSAGDAARAGYETAKTQRERVLTVVARAKGKGITPESIAATLLWPIDSVEYWLRQLLELGDVMVSRATALDDDATLRYVATEIPVNDDEELAE